MDFGDGMIGFDDVSESPDREEPVCLRRYSIRKRSWVEIEVATGTLSLPQGIRPVANELTGNAALLPTPGKKRCSL